MRKRKKTPGYYFFYLLFLPESWRVLIGLAAAYGLLPLVVYTGMTTGGKALLFIMLATIGYTASGVPARWMSRTLKRLLLGDRQP